MANLTNGSDKLSELVRRIHDRTMEGKISWEQTSDDEVLLAAFPNYTVQLMESPTYADGEYLGLDYVLAIHDEHGKLAGEVRPRNMEDDNNSQPISFSMKLFSRLAAKQWVRTLPLMTSCACCKTWSRYAHREKILRAKGLFREQTLQRVQALSLHFLQFTPSLLKVGSTFSADCHNSRLDMVG